MIGRMRISGNIIENLLDNKMTSYRLNGCLKKKMNILRRILEMADGNIVDASFMFKDLAMSIPQMPRIYCKSGDVL